MTTCRYSRTRTTISGSEGINEYIDIAICVLDIALSFAVWPLVWRLYRVKTANEHTLLTSIPSGAMIAVVGWLFWCRGDLLIALAHVPSATGWLWVAALTILYRKGERKDGVEVPRLYMFE